MTRILPMTEVLMEPGSHRVWVTYADEQTHHVDLSSLVATETFRALRLPPLFAQVRLSADGRCLIWPGGARLDASSILLSPNGPLPVQLVAVVPAKNRYRPLLPFLQYQQVRSYLHPLPIAPSVVQRLFQLRAGELDQMLDSLAVPADVMINRLYDLATFLTLHFSSEHLSVLMRRPWRYAELAYPSQTFLHSMLGCLRHGRPDLVERPCLLLLTGEA